ncbi:hypothetical protein [Pseudofrankia asymbiotica]|uniref:Uncharacterized protein n=1 Tax=Pseudofrankia asymbiotica TaxID=1834516 RepID=A0A1V2HZ30_9ACTN|nr:hypothetical protein [Pseudofrankia asymbiotica]ONH21885.1 hypothetical protein BL253_37515 [Pseudofrankia asymbiotica]
MTTGAALAAGIAAKNLTGPAFTTVEVAIGTLGVTGLCVLAGLFAVIATADGAGGDAGTAVRRALPRLGGLVGIGLVIGLLGNLELYGRDILPFGVRLLMGLLHSWLWVLTALAAPVFAVEGGTTRAAFVRSYRLVHGRMWATYGLLVVAQLFQTAVWYVCYHNALDGSTATGDGVLTVGDRVVIAAVALLAHLIVSPLFAALLAVIFMDYRLRPPSLRFPGEPPTNGFNSAKEWPRPLGW